MVTKTTHARSRPAVAFNLPSDQLGLKKRVKTAKTDLVVVQIRSRFMLASPVALRWCGVVMRGVVMGVFRCVRKIAFGLAFAHAASTEKLAK